MTTSTDHAEPLISALANLSPAERGGLIAWLAIKITAGTDHQRVVWHKLAALAAQVNADERRAVEELELALDDFEMGAIVDDTAPEEGA